MLNRLFDFLFSLHRVHFGEGTRLEFVYGNLLLVILCALVLAVVGFLTYLPQSAVPAKKNTMGILRGVLLAVVVLLVFRPQLVMEHEDRLRSVVAVWVDNSASMSLDDPYLGARADPKMRDYMQKVAQGLTAATASAPRPGRPTRYQLATATLRDAQWLRDLSSSQDILFFTGSSRAQPVGLASTPAEVDARIAQIQAGEASGSSTDVPTVVRDILQRVQGQRLSAILLLTDGQTTEAGSRLDQAIELAQATRIVTIPFGQEEEPYDLKLTNLRLPESTFSRDPVSARFHVAATGLAQPLPARLSVYRKRPDGTIDTAAPLATRDITLDPAKPELDAELAVRLKKTDPGKSEKFELVARMEPASPTALEERTLENNQQTRTVTVLDAQMNVLYVEGYPRWEYRYLKNELIREPTVNVSTLLLTGDEGWVQDADPQVVDKATGEEKFPGPLNHFPDNARDLDKYDVLLVGDVYPTYFSPTQQKLIVDWVKTRGGGLGWIAGNQFNPEAYRDTALEVLLPIIPDEVDPRARLLPPPENRGYVLNLTPAGKETNLFRFFDDPDTSWKQVANLPYMFWYKPVPGLKPGSIVLADLPSRAVNGSPAPLLVTRQFGAGPVLFSAYCDTWRWRQYTGEPLFQSYWLQLCRLLCTNKALGQTRRIELAAQSTQVEIGAPIKVTMTVKDASLTGQIPSEAQVMLVDNAGRTVQTITLSHPAAPEPGALERLEGSVTAAQLGEFTLQPKAGELPIEVASLGITVQQPQREYQTLIADTASLQTLAAKTGGGMFKPYAAQDARKDIPDRSMPQLKTDSEELWNKPIALILVLLIATAEWLTRKSAGLI